MSGLKKEPREDLAVVWQEFDSGDWLVTRMVGYLAPEDGSKYVTGCELVCSKIVSSGVIKAGSKREALLKYAASGRAGSVWSIDAVDFRPSMDSGDITKWYRLVKEDF